MRISLFFRCPPNVPDTNRIATSATAPAPAPAPMQIESTTFAMTAPSTTIPTQFSNFNHLKTTESAIPSAVTTVAATSMSHIPIYQYNNYFSQSNSARNHVANDAHGGGVHLLTAAAASDSIRTEMNTFRHIQHESISNQSAHDAHIQQIVHSTPAAMTSVAQTQTINQPERLYGQSISPPSLYQRQPFPINQNQLHREQLTELLRHTAADVAYTSAVSTLEQNRMRSASPRTQSFPEQNAQIIGSPNRFQQLQYYSNATPATIDRHDGPMYGDTRLDNLNKFYKTTLTLQGQHPPNDDFDEPIGKVLLKRDTVYNKLGNSAGQIRLNQEEMAPQFQFLFIFAGHETLHRNNSLSPFLQRKLSLQAQQHRVAAYDPSAINRWHAHPGYGTSMSATASPNLDARKRFQTAIPAFDSDESSVVRLHGNTSPIGLFCDIRIGGNVQLKDAEANFVYSSSCSLAALLPSTKSIT